MTRPKNLYYAIVTVHLYISQLPSFQQWLSLIPLFLLSNRVSDLLSQPTFFQVSVSNGSFISKPCVHSHGYSTCSFPDFLSSLRAFSSSLTMSFAFTSTGYENSQSRFYIRVPSVSDRQPFIRNSSMPIQVRSKKIGRSCICPLIHISPRNSH